MKCMIIGLCALLCITMVFGSQSQKKIEKKSKSKNEITKQLPEINGKLSKTLYTIDQVDLIVCDHREASFTFKCTFEYAKIDLKFGLEENKRKRICSQNGRDSVKLCKSLQFLGCHPDIGLPQWCNERKADIDEQRKYWHMTVGQICHKNLIKHVQLCKNNKKKIKEGDKHISAEQIAEFYNKYKLRKTTIKPMPLVSQTKPSKVISVEHEAVIEHSANQILIDYIFDESQFSIEKLDLVTFIDHVFNEVNKTAQKPVKPSIVVIPTKPQVAPHKPFKSTSKPEYVEHIISEGISGTGKPSVVYSKAKVNPRLTELLLDYIYGVNRPNETTNEIQLFVDYLYEEKQKVLEESKLRTNLVEIIIGFKPFVDLGPPIKLPIDFVPIKEPIKLVTTKKPHSKQIFTKKPHVEFKPFLPSKPPFQSVPIKEPIKPQTRKPYFKPAFTKKPHVPIQPIIKPKPVVPIIVPRDEFDISFIFKIADELLTLRDRIEYLNSNGESNLEHYNFLVGQKTQKTNKSKKINDNELESDNNEINRDKEKIIFVKRNKNEAINDLMMAMGA